MTTNKRDVQMHVGSGNVYADRELYLAEEVPNGVHAFGGQREMEISTIPSLMA